jgi:hypothetical protein
VGKINTLKTGSCREETFTDCALQLKAKKSQGRYLCSVFSMRRHRSNRRLEVKLRVCLSKETGQRTVHCVDLLLLDETTFCKGARSDGIRQGLNGKQYHPFNSCKHSQSRSRILKPPRLPLKSGNLNKILRPRIQLTSLSPQWAMSNQDLPIPSARSPWRHSVRDSSHHDSPGLESVTKAWELLLRRALKNVQTPCLLEDG